MGASFHKCLGLAWPESRPRGDVAKFAIQTATKIQPKNKSKKKTNKKMGAWFDKCLGK